VEAPPPADRRAEAPTKEEVATDARTEALAYTYDAVDRRDPYESWFDQMAVTEEGRTELEKLELDSLKLSGVVLGTTPRALITDSGGKGHIVGVGTTIGKKRGVIRVIRPGEILIEERIRMWDGRYLTTTKAMQLSS
jgi:Tfp pilus assembly protein PilP